MPAFKEPREIMLITIKAGDDLKSEYDELQVQRSTLRRLISIREATWSQLSINRSDLPTIEAEEHMWRTYYEKLEALDSRLRKLLVLPTTEELALERNEWEDRIAEYQEKLAKGWGKLAHIRNELTKVSGQAAKLDTTLQGRDDSSRMNQVIVKQEPKIWEFSQIFGRCKKVSGLLPNIRDCSLQLRFGPGSIQQTQ